jgi:hypothetical protein
MHTEHVPDDPKVLEEMGFDRRDINVKSIRDWTIYITVGSIACVLISIPIYNYLTVKGPFWDSVRGVNRQYQTKSNIRITSPNPILQDNITAKLDTVELRKAEEKQLKSAGWVDKSKGVVHIPVEMAMDHIAERGVGTGKQVTAQPSKNTIPINTVGQPKGN